MTVAGVTVFVPSGAVSYDPAAVYARMSVHYKTRTHTHTSHVTTQLRKGKWNCQEEQRLVRVCVCLPS